MKHLFVVNPAAGSKDMSDEIGLLAQKAFESRTDEFEVYTTKAPGDATEEVRKRADSGEHYHIYSCGGDGTFNECVSGAVNRDNIAVCPFPLGTGNDFCRMFGDEQALFRNMEAVIDGTEHNIDVIECNGRYSVDICSAGIDARIGTNVHKYTSFPLFRGGAGYVVSAIVEIIKGINQHMVIHADGYEANGRFALVCVCNGRFYGGGFNPSPDAMPDDGLLEIYIVRNIGLVQLASVIGKYSSGRADEMPKYVKHLRGKRISIEFDDAQVINLDGEAIFTDKAEISLVPEAVKMIIPRGMRFFEKM